MSAAASATGRERLTQAQLWVVKIGSALLTAGSAGIDRDAIVGWCGQIAALHGSGRRVVLVTSGAVAEGCRRLGLAERPRSIHALQAAAAAGQMGLVEAYEQGFKRFSLGTAMVLLTHEDLADRRRYLNARATLRTLLDMGVVPVINENDSVATDEIRFGDNDTLSALAAAALAADALVLLTDQDGLHEQDPRRQPDAPLVHEAAADDASLDAYAGGGGRFGRGGMVTKLAAARLAARAGTQTVIANGATPDVLARLGAGERVGTLLEATVAPLVARKRWIAGQLRPKGEIALDDGAVAALKERGVSVLAVGVIGAKGQFSRGDVVRVTDAGGAEVGKGLVNYNASETRRLAGRGSAEIEAVLGYVDEPELIHRDNLVVL